jgi:hypothetical protein
MRLSRRDLARFAGSAAASAGLAQVIPGRQAIAQTPEAAPTGSGANSALLSLLKFIPLSLVEENYSEGSELGTFGDIALRLDSVGVEIPDSASGEDAVREAFRATMPIPSGSLIQASARADDSVGLLGWTIADVDRQLFTMTSEGGLVHVMQGAFDAGALEAAWTANGYEMLEVEGQAVASLSAEPDMNIETELGRLALSHVNNAALLDGGTLVYSPSLDTLTLMLQANAGTVPSVGTYEMVERVVGAVTQPLSGASVLPGPALVMLGDPLTMVLGESVDLEDIDLEDFPEPGPLPLMGLVGFVSGSAVPDPSLLENEDAEPVVSGSTLVASRLYTSPGDAAIAAKRSLLFLETGVSFVTRRPYAEQFAGWRVDHHQDSDIVTLEVDLYANEGVWLQMIYNRDAQFLYS